MQLLTGWRLLWQHLTFLAHKELLALIKDPRMKVMLILPPILPAIGKAYGIDPLVFVPVLALACCAFFMAYQNQWVLMSENIAGKFSWTSKHRVQYAIIYFVAAIISILVCVPLYQSWGLIS